MLSRVRLRLLNVLLIIASCLRGSLLAGFADSRETFSRPIETVALDRTDALAVPPIHFFQGAHDFLKTTPYAEQWPLIVGLVGPNPTRLAQTLEIVQFGVERGAIPEHARLEWIAIVGRTIAHLSPFIVRIAVARGISLPELKRLSIGTSHDAERLARLMDVRTRSNKLFQVFFLDGRLSAGVVTLIEPLLPPKESKEALPLAWLLFRWGFTEETVGPLISAAHYSPLAGEARLVLQKALHTISQQGRLTTRAFDAGGLTLRWRHFGTYVGAVASLGKEQVVRWRKEGFSWRTIDTLSRLEARDREAALNIAGQYPVESSQWDAVLSAVEAGGSEAANRMLGDWDIPPGPWLEQAAQSLAWNRHVIDPVGFPKELKGEVLTREAIRIAREAGRSVKAVDPICHLLLQTFAVERRRERQTARQENRDWNWQAVWRTSLAQVEKAAASGRSLTRLSERLELKRRWGRAFDQTSDLREDPSHWLALRSVALFQATERNVMLEHWRRLKSAEFELPTGIQVRSAIDPAERWRLVGGQIRMQLSHARSGQPPHYRLELKPSDRATAQAIKKRGYQALGFASLQVFADGLFVTNVQAFHLFPRLSNRLRKQSRDYDATLLLAAVEIARRLRLPNVWVVPTAVKLNESVSSGIPPYLAARNYGRTPFLLGFTLRPAALKLKDEVVEFVWHAPVDPDPRVGSPGEELRAALKAAA